MLELSANVRLNRALSSAANPFLQLVQSPIVYHHTASEFSEL